MDLMKLDRDPTQPATNQHTKEKENSRRGGGEGGGGAEEGKDGKDTHR